MAKTFPKNRISVAPEEFNSVVAQSGLEADNETFKRGAPLVLTAGLLAEAASPVAAGSLVGWAAEDAHNTTGARVQFIPAKPGQLFYINFLGAAGADNVLDQGDFGGDFDIELAAAGHPDGGQVWYLLDAAGTANAATMISDKADISPADQLSTRAEAGDTNARVLCRLLAAALA